MASSPAPGKEGSAPEMVAVDWGTTRLRLRFLREAPSACGSSAEEASAEGVANLRPGEHEGVFLRRVEALLAPLGRWEAASRSGVDVYFSGMVTSSLGWIPTGYQTIPAGPEDLLRGMRRERRGALRLHFFPGLRTADDVLRGEEVEALGLLSWMSGEGGGGPRRVVLPGTHSKWILWDGASIADFVTVMTGDLHAALHRSTLLARTLPPEPVAVEGALLEDFDRGVDLARSKGALAALFRARALPLLEGLAPEGASALLSGALIGGEVLEQAERCLRGQGASASGALRKPVLVGGAPPLARLYVRAAARAGISAEAAPDEASALASAEGLWLLRERERARAAAQG